MIATLYNGSGPVSESKASQMPAVPQICNLDEFRLYLKSLKTGNEKQESMAEFLKDLRSLHENSKLALQ